MYELLQVMSISHANHVINGDLKPANILLDKNYHVAVCDWGFGLHTSQYHHRIMDTHVLQTLSYRAPEVLCRLNPYNDVIDVWCLGIILCELINQQLMFNNPSTDNEATDQQLDNIFNTFGYPNVVMWEKLYKKKKYSYCGDNIRTLNHLRSVINTTDELCLDLIDQMTQYDPEKRCHCLEAMTHPYFNQVRVSCEIITSQSNEYTKNIDPMRYSAEMGFTDKDREMVLKRAISYLTEYKLPNTIYFAGLVYFDEYVSSHKIRRDDLLVTCLCCMFIAEKINGYLFFNITDIIAELYSQYDTDHTRDIRQLELRIVRYFNYSFFRLNLYHILSHYLEQLHVGREQQSDIVRLYCRMTYTPEFYKYDQHHLIPTLIAYYSEHPVLTNNIGSIFDKCRQNA
jgi:hypothetical protein